MKTLNRKLIYLLLLIIFYSVTKTGIAAQTPIQPEKCELTFAWSQWPPFIALKDDKMVGSQADFLKWVEQEMGCSFKFVEMDWSESLHFLEKGDVDFVGNASYLESRKISYRYSDIYVQYIQVLTIRQGDKERLEQKSLSQLLEENFVLGVFKGGYLSDEVERLRNTQRASKNIRYYTSQSNLINALRNKEIDGFFEAPFALDDLMQNNPHSYMFEEYPNEIIMDDFYFLFSRKSVKPFMVNRFNKAMSKVKQSTEYKAHPFWSTVR